MGSMSIWHWLIALCVIILIFGTKRLGTMGTDIESAILHLRKTTHRHKKPAGQKFWTKVVVGSLLVWALLTVAERVIAR